MTLSKSLSSLCLFPHVGNANNDPPPYRTAATIERENHLTCCASPSASPPQSEKPSSKRYLIDETVKPGSFSDRTGAAQARSPSDGLLLWSPRRLLGGTRLHAVRSRPWGWGCTGNPDKSRPLSAAAQTLLSPGRQASEQLTCRDAIVGGSAHRSLD